MRAPRGGRFATMAVATALVGIMPAAAQDAPVGPCSPYRAADGDIPSEMPGCARHRRPAAGSLDDELAFARRRREGELSIPDDIDDEAPARRLRPRRHRE